MVGNHRGQICGVSVLWLCLTVCFLAGAFAISSATAATTSQFGERKALVIGNSDYLHVNDLPGAARDAQDIAGALAQLGFKTQLVENATLQQLTKVFDDLVRTSTKSDSIFIFFSGHGFQIGNENFLAPVDLGPAQDGLQNKFNLSEFLPKLVKASKVRVLFPGRLQG